MEVRAKKALGQHFLTDLSIAQRIAEALTVPCPGVDTVYNAENPMPALEVGPGMGVLTQYVLQRPEVDLRMVEIDTESVDYLLVHFPQVNGKLIKLYVDYNDTVTNGQIVAEIDPLVYEANYKSAVARLHVSQAGVLTSECALKQREAELVLAQKTFDRKKTLSEKKMAPVADYDSAVEALDKAGIVEQDAPRRMLKAVKPFMLEKDGKSIAVEPYDGFRVDYTIRFPHPVIGEQRFVLDVTPGSFREQIANARTFGFFREAEYLRSKGLARGCSLDNVIVIDDNGVMNEGGLRFPDEFVRHKILDFIGDMAMLGRPMLGAFTVACSGHAHNNAFLRQLVQIEGALAPVES